MEKSPYRYEYEQQPDDARDNEIKKLIDIKSTITPLLHFEYVQLNAKIGKMQTEIDNSIPDDYGIAQGRCRILSATVNELSGIIKNSKEIKCPEKDYPKATLGSIVIIEYDIVNDRESKEECYILAGAHFTSEDETYQINGKDIKPMAIKSAAGRSIFGHMSGEPITVYTENGCYDAKILHVEQYTGEDQE